MSGIHCKCGKYFSTGSHPHSTGHYAISEKNFDEIEADSIDKDTFRKLFFEAKNMYQCSHCRRLILSNNETEGGWDFYRPEDV